MLWVRVAHPAQIWWVFVASGAAAAQAIGASDVADASLGAGAVALSRAAGGAGTPAPGGR